jgi:Brp/Blh family beta-carotene 15,15'-monooxygenase
MNVSASTGSLPRPVHLFPHAASGPVDLERSHYRWALAALIVAVLSAPFASSLTLTTQLFFLAGTVGLLGLPHGALDFLQARRVLEPRLGRLWPIPFATGYGAVIALVLAAWYWFPGASLFVFLVASALHFGAEDTMAYGLPGPMRIVEVLSRGSLPILVPLAFHPETTEFLGWLLPASSALAAGSLQQTAQVALAAAAVVIVAASWLGTSRSEVARIVVLASMFAVLPPLVSFPVYFCIWHAPRHVLAVSRQLSLSPGEMTKSLAVVAAPLTGLALAGGLAVWLYLRESGIDFAPATARVVFIGLSALTAPHMLAGTLFERQT